MESIEEIRKKGKRLTEGMLFLSNKYIYNGTFYKFFPSNSNIEVIEKVLTSLYNNPIDDCAKITSLLYEDTIVGYGMEYYKKYKELAKVRITSADLKKTYISKLISIHEELKRRGFLFYDLHGHNILVDSDELRLIDLDSCVEFNEKRNIVVTKYLTDLITEILFNVRFFEYRIYYGKETQKRMDEFLYSDLGVENMSKISLQELNNYIQGLTRKEINNKQKQIKHILRR